MTSRDDWWVTAFDADYLARYAHRDDRQAATEVAGVLPRLRAAPGPLLDACCGAGRHLEALRRAGLRAFGFDYSLPLLQAAAARPEARGRLLRGDLRAPPIGSGWGAITLFFTAFGYFDDATNAAALAGLAGLLVPGGWLMLDLPDPAQVRRQLVAESRRHLADGSLVVERRRMQGPRVVKRSHWRAADGAQRTVEERVRLYDRGELQALAAAAGLAVQEIWSSLTGRDEPGDRQIVWMRR